VGHPVPIEEHDEQPGDVRRTGGSNQLAAMELNWTPQTSLLDGIGAQVDWHRRRRQETVL
jgi:nucleoside-diphosphate-sugar epimerase